MNQKPLRSFQRTNSVSLATFSRNSSEYASYITGQAIHLNDDEQLNTYLFGVVPKAGY